jgi:hypothetical protein
VPYPPCTVTAFWLKYQDSARLLRRVTQPPHIAGPLAIILHTMNRLPIIYILILLLTTTCRNQKSSTIRPVPTDDSITSISLTSPQSNTPSRSQDRFLKLFDWDSVTTLKNNFTKYLFQNKYSQDSLIVTFLDDYSKIIRHFNEILFDLSNYDSLNTLIWADKSKVLQCAVDFEKTVENNGLKIAFSEGSIYITKNTNFIKEDIINVIDPISKEFIILYCSEVDSICCDDAAIIISKKTLTNRILKWGNLLEKTSHLMYSKIASSEFSSNLNLLYNGQDNTPAFDWTTGKFSQESIKYMNEVIQSSPNSLAAKEFRLFLDLLQKEDYTRTEKVIQFLDIKFK